MPSPHDQVALLIGGKAHSDWTSYDIDSNLLTPADGWQVSLGMPDGALPPVVKKGATVEVRVGDDRVLTGRIDEITHSVSKGEHTLAISGRDGAAVLVDCSAPIFVARQVTLAEIVAKVVRPLGITKTRIDAAATKTREKVNVEPGDTAWDVLMHAAEANGLWPWFTPDGTLVVGGPDYSTPPAATLILRRDGAANNVLSLRETISCQESHSDITVLGQAHGTEARRAQSGLKATAKDTGIDWYRPRIVVDHDADSLAVCEARARKAISDSRLRAYTLEATVQGQRATHTDRDGNAPLWAPGMRVHVISEPHGLDGIYFLMARRFVGGRDQGTVTHLTLKEDGVWTLDAHPHKRKHRRGKNSLPGKVLEVADPVPKP